MALIEVVLSDLDRRRWNCAAHSGVEDVID
jgi:hypothetical protein